MAGSFRCLNNGGILSVHFTDAKILDATSIEQMHRDLIRLLDETQDKKLLLDFTQVQFMSSAALGMLIRVHKKCRERGIALKLCSIAPQIIQVFKVTSLDRVFEIHPNEAAAMATFT